MFDVHSQDILKFNSSCRVDSENCQMWESGRITANLAQTQLPIWDQVGNEE